MRDKPPYYMIWLLLFFIAVTFTVLIVAMALKSSSSIEYIPFLKTVSFSSKLTN